MSWERGQPARLKCTRCSTQWTIVIGDSSGMDVMDRHRHEECIGCVEADFPDCPDDE